MTSSFLNPGYSAFSLAGKYYDPSIFNISQYTKGNSNNSSYGVPSLEGMTPEERKQYIAYAALRPTPATTDFAGLTGFMREQADIASKVAKEKYNQEFMGQGIGALAGGLKTLIAGGSPEMVAYLSQTPERGAAAYLEGYNSVGPRQNAIPRTYGSSTRRSYFNT